jgi:hypothetical protein
MTRFHWTEESEYRVYSCHASYLFDSGFATGASHDISVDTLFLLLRTSYLSQGDNTKIPQFVPHAIKSISFTWKILFLSSVFTFSIF